DRRHLQRQRTARNLRQCRRRACRTRPARRILDQSLQVGGRAAARGSCSAGSSGRDTTNATRRRAERRQPHVARLPVVVARPLREKGDTEMSKLQVTDMLARAFAAEGVDTLFTLMGDANMYWSVAMAKLPGMKVVHARHEHCAVAMADGYARATGKVGVASTTCGPGFTQIMTALTISARSNTPLVVFAGDSPLASSWYIQQIDM